MRKLLVLLACYLLMSYCVPYAAASPDTAYGWLQDDQSGKATQLNSEWNYFRIRDRRFVWRQLADKESCPASLQTTNLSPYLILNNEPLAAIEGEIVLEESGFSIVLLATSEYDRLKSLENVWFSINPLPANTDFITRAVAAEFDSATTPADTETLLSYITRPSYDRYLWGISSFRTRYYASSEVNDATAWIIRQFEAMGYSVELDSYVYNSIPQNNLIARKVGSVTPDDWYIVCAHYDSINRFGSNNPAPGADDNGSGIATVLEIARVLADATTDVSILFAAWGTEERGLIGSKEYIEHMTDSQQLDKIKAVINIDMIAYQEPGLEKWRVYVCREDISAWIKDSLISAASKYTELDMYETAGSTSNSDHRSFLSGGIPAVGIREQQYTPHYHTEDDTYENANPAAAFETIRMVLGGLAGIVKIEPGPRPSGYYDLNGDHRIQHNDLLMFQSAWMQDATPEAYPYSETSFDFNNSGRVDSADLLHLLSQWRLEAGSETQQ
jgi:Peptidase family M28/Dockerin type I domain